jgi:hypothetical protein
MTNAIYEFNGKQYIVTGKHTGEVSGFPNDERDIYPHNVFLISVKREAIVRRFNYYGSSHDHDKGKTELTEQDLMFCFRCFIEDAEEGNKTFEEFCGDLGYDKDSRRAEKIYKACGRQLKKALDLGIFASELCDILNDLSDKGIA